MADMTRTAPLLPKTTLMKWRALQLIVWGIGVAMFVALIVSPEVGLHAFWNVLIPVAPALFAIAPGLWRNVCPLGSTALLGRHMGWTAQRKLPPVWQDRFGLIGVGLLLLIVPLRHVVLDTSGAATALALGVIAVLAVVVSTQWHWKSAWCSGMCPVHPVEKLYGSEPIASFANAHCHECEECTVPCPDSTPGVTPLPQMASRSRRVAAMLMVGAFPGFIWGWFQVGDYRGVEGWSHAGLIYGMSIMGAAVTLVALLVALRWSPDEWGPLLRRVFAAGAISCYYWYRLPWLFGFGGFAPSGMLVDLQGVLPAWFPIASRIVTTGFFVWWLVGRRAGQTTWLVRPRRRQPALVEA